MCVWSISPHLTCFICLINTSDYSCWTDGLYMCDLSYCPAVVLVSVWLLIVVFVGQWCCRRSVIWSCMTSLTAPCVRAGGRQKGLLGTWSCTRHWQRASPRTRRRWKIHTHTHYRSSHRIWMSGVTIWTKIPSGTSRNADALRFVNISN